MNLQDQFVNGVDKMHDIAYSTVGGNARAWAAKAERKGIIDQRQKSEINNMIDTRVFISHGGAGRVIITQNDINMVNRYISIMNSTSGRFKGDPDGGMPTGTFRSYVKELNFDGKKQSYYFKFEIVYQYQERAYDDGTYFKGRGYVIYVREAPYKDWCLQNNRNLEFHYYAVPQGNESICWNALITTFEDANKVMFVWAKRYVKILESLIENGKLNINSYDTKQKKKYSVPVGTFRQREILISDKVIKAIKKTIGSIKPEQGGILGISGTDDVIDFFEHDKKARVGYAEYTPNVTYINQIINEDWMTRSVDFCGFIHSHPYPSKNLSDADIEYAVRIMREFDLAYLYMPLVNSRADGRFNIYGYIVYANGDVERCPVKEVKEANPSSVFSEGEEKCNEATLSEDEIMAVFDNNRFNVVKTDTKEQFKRLDSSLPLEYLKGCTVIGIGCGGAREFYIDLARLGIENFYLMDGDKVSLTNIGTQNVYLNEVGMNKCDVIRERLLLINNEVNVECYPVMLDDSVTDEWLECNILNKSDLSKTILCAFTDNFFAQARISNIALKYNIPLISAQHHQYGDTSEIVYWYPGLSVATPASVLKDRYLAYQNGYINDVTSEGSPIFNTVRLNGLCEKIALGMLLYNYNSYHKYSLFLTLKPEYNLIWIRQNTLIDSQSVLKDLFSTDERYFFDDAIWIKQSDEFKGHNEIADTRDVFIALNQR